jgi:hypothetical protein
MLILFQVLVEVSYTFSSVFGLGFMTGLTGLATTLFGGSTIGV